MVLTSPTVRQRQLPQQRRQPAGRICATLASSWSPLPRLALLCLSNTIGIPMESRCQGDTIGISNKTGELVAFLDNNEPGGELWSRNGVLGLSQGVLPSWCDVRVRRTRWPLPLCRRGCRLARTAARAGPSASNHPRRRCAPGQQRRERPPDWLGRRS